MISRTTYEKPDMIRVFSVAYFHNKDHIVTEHTFNNLDIACQVVAEVWAFEEKNVYTIVDDSYLEGK